MFKKIIFTILLVLLTSSFSFAESDYFDLSTIDEGILKVNYENTENKKIKIMIQKDNEKAFHNLSEFNQYPLTFGNGKYVIAILENVDGTKYKSISVKKIDVVISGELNVYLSPNQTLNWNENMKAIIKAKELTKGMTSNKEKALVIHDYLVTNLKYDYNKINSIDNSYIPNIEATFTSNTGICSDFASLYGAMLRSVGVPTKYVKGYKNDISTYHAWNQVYLEDSKTWITVDITYDNALYENDKVYSFEKDSTEYTIKGEL